MNFEAVEINMSQWKREFPLNVRDALMKAEELINSASTSSRHQGIKQNEIAMELITESVFCETDRRGCSKTLNCLQEAELMEVISDHMLYDARGSEASRNALFQALFPVSAPSRMHFLVSLISLAISTRNAPVLKASSLLLQHAGCSTQFSGTIAKGLVEEFFILVNTNCQVVIDLPKIAPLFTIVFLSALTQGYLCIDGNSNQRFPPDCFVEVITRWIRENKTLCFAFSELRSDFRPQTLYIGLFTWCIMSCLSGRGDVYTELYDILTISYKGGYILDVDDLNPLVNRLSTLSTSKSNALNREESFSFTLERFTSFLTMVATQNCLFVDQNFWMSVSAIQGNKLLLLLAEKQLQAS